LTTATDLDVGTRDLWDVVGDLELPLLLIELDKFTVTDATPSFFKEVGVSESSVLHRPLYKLFSGTDQISSRLALGALADGLIDFYSAHRQLTLPDKHRITLFAWVRSIQFGESRHALAEFSTSLEPRDSPLVEYLGYSPPKMAVGTTDDDGNITAISNSVIDVIGETPESLIGRPLLSDKEQRRLCDQINALKDGGSLTVSLPVQMEGLASRNKSVRCIVTCLAESTSRVFLLLPGPDAATASKFDRIAQLEHRLWRIASEVQASGIFDSLGTFPDPERFPQLSSLTTRQWEVLSRLLRGERAPAIAKDLFVSPSTIRNNLSEIFRIFDVHSQSELLNLLTH
jgi:DNA-binding CsgD family transcriptional regulator